MGNILHVRWEFCSDMFVWHLSFGNFHVGPLYWELSFGCVVGGLSFGIFHLATFAWGLSRGCLRLEISARELQLVNFPMGPFAFAVVAWDLRKVRSGIVA